MFNGHFSGTTQARRYQKGKTSLDFTEARHSEWQWHQLGHMEVCTSFQTDNHARTTTITDKILQAASLEHTVVNHRDLVQTATRYISQVVSLHKN